MNAGIRNISGFLERIPIFYRVIIANSAMVLVVVLALLALESAAITVALVLACGVMNALLVRAALSPAAQLRELLAVTRNTAERERERVASELRDGAAQRLAVLALKAAGNHAFSAEARAVMQELCETAQRLEPSALRLAGLKGALSWLAADVAERRGSTIRVLCDVDSRQLSYPAARGVYRLLEDVIQTAASNCRQDIELTVAPEGNQLVCAVWLDCLFDDADCFRHNEWARSLGGAAVVQRNGKRTVFRANIPLAESQTNVRYDSRLAG